MFVPPKTIDEHLVYLNPVLLEVAGRNKGLSQKEICSNAKKYFGLSSNTVFSVLKGKGVYPDTAKKVADFFGYKVEELVAPWDRLCRKPPEPAGPWSGSPEWESNGCLQGGRLAPNGLFHVVYRMQHRHTKAKYGRGKFYILSWLRSEEKEAKRDQLTRHSDVCACVGRHDHIVMNHTSTPAVNNEGWWVVDEWVGEMTVADYLESQPWPLETLPRLLLEVARGVDGLHQAGVVFRELAPSRILVSDKDKRAVLTDFELAKLLDSGPSGSKEWPEDPFRAPEVEGGTVTEGADLYSLAMVASAAIAGPGFDPESVPPIETLKASNMPKRVLRLLVDSLGPLNRRPPEMTPVLKELARWAEG